MIRNEGQAVSAAGVVSSCSVVLVALVVRERASTSSFSSYWL